MLAFLVILTIIIACVFGMKRWQKHMDWYEHVYLYRVRCIIHNQTVKELSEYPNTTEYWCSLCSWEEKDNLIIESRAINYFSEWE